MWHLSNIRFWVLSLCALYSIILPAQTYPLLDDNTNIVGEECVVIAREEDTLLDIARRHNLGYTEVVAANPNVDPWLPKKGTRIVLPKRHILPDTPRVGVVLNIATMRIFYYPEVSSEGKRVVITYPIGIGREGWGTPTVTTAVTAKIKDPAWTVPASILAERQRDGDPLPAVVPPGPANPLGKFALRLDIPRYLIHGTNKRYGAGMRVTHGCIRLYPEDIEELFSSVQIGTPVRIIDEPYLAAWENGVMYLEAHPVLAEDGTLLKRELAPVVKVIIRATENGRQLSEANWKRAMDVAAQQRVVPQAITKRSDAKKKDLICTMD